MSAAMHFLIMFLALAGFGVYQGIRGLRKLRAERDYPGAILSWTERPLSGPSHEGLSYLMMLVHWSGVSVLALGSLVTVLLWEEASRDFRTFTSSGSEQAMWLAALVGIVFTGYLWGRVLFYPFGSPFAGQSHYSISTDGLLFGGYLFPWPAFSHFSLDRRSQVLTIWSATSSGHVAFALKPISEDLRGELQSQISEYLSSVPQSREPGSKWLPVGRMVLLTAGAVALGAALVMLLGVSGLAGIAILLFVFMRLGGGLLMKGAYGGLARQLEG